MRRPYDIKKNSKKGSRPQSIKKIKAKKSQSKKNTNKVISLFLIIGFVLSALANIAYFEEIDFMNGFSVGFLPRTFAENNSETKGEKEENSASQVKELNSSSSEEVNGKVKRNISYIDTLNERKKSLDEREERVAILERELQKKERDLLKRLNELKQMRKQISEVLETRVKEDRVKVLKLVDFYSNMKPKKAADIFNSLNEDLAVDILGNMKKKNAAAIMNLLKPEKALLLSEKFAGYKTGK